MTREALDLLQKQITQDRDRTVHLPEDQSDGPDTSWKNSTIAARSSRDPRANVVESPLRRADAID